MTRPNEFGDMSDDAFLDMTPAEMEEAAKALAESDDKPPVNDDDNDEDHMTDAEKAAAEQAKAGDDEDDEAKEKARWEALSEEEREAENKEADKENAETDRREALSDEERIAEDAAAEEAQKVADAAAAKETARREALSDAEQEAEDAAAAAEASSGDTDFAAVGKAIMAEFTANGKPMKVKSAEDAIQLMQMGANYHKKMKALKPRMRMLKLLENHGLLEDEKLNFVIDLYERKPEAIAKLLKDSKIDPMDIDVDDDNNYVPEKRTVSDTEMNIDEVLEKISHTKSYDRTLNVIGKEWDDASRTAITSDPKIIAHINGHIESGIFDQVAEQVAYQQSLGKLIGMTDLDAYQQVGQHMSDNNMFRQAGAPAGGRKAENADNPDADKLADAARKANKKAASSSRRRKAPAKSESDYDPLNMSDEDYIKLNNLQI